MGRAGHHGERAFEWLLRRRGVPFVSVNESRRACGPQGEGEQTADRVAEGGGVGPTSVGLCPCSAKGLKNFDYCVYAPGGGLLVDVKCRRMGRGALGGRCGSVIGLPNWATGDDLASLAVWQGLFGAGFTAAVVYVYWRDEGEGQPGDGLFDEVFLWNGRWYALRTVRADDYRAAMRPRSPRWGTVHLPSRGPGGFERLCEVGGRVWRREAGHQP